MLERKLRGKRNSTGFCCSFLAVLLNVRNSERNEKFPSFEFHLVKISKDFFSMKSYRCKLHLS